MKYCVTVLSTLVKSVCEYCSRRSRCSEEWGRLSDDVNAVLEPWTSPNANESVIVDLVKSIAVSGNLIFQEEGIRALRGKETRDSINL